MPKQTIQESLTFDKKRLEIITGEEIAFHEGSQIMLPKNMSFETADKVLKRLAKEAETETLFSRKYRFRPDDGAVATLTVLRKHFGMVLGKEIQTFFGKRPAETRDVATGVGTTVTVPWGHIEVPVLDNTIMFLGEVDDREYGPIYQFTAKAPKKYKVLFDQILDDIGTELAEHSIYRGQALIGAKTLEFYDLRNFDPDQIVFSQEALAQLQGTLWAVMEHTQVLREEDIPRKRAILLEGPYGTGKTSAGIITAHKAKTHGWTFLSARPGRDRVEDVLRTARLYQPAVVFIEDIDTEGAVGDSDLVTRLLDAFDGVTSKGGEVMMVMTTNHLSRIHKGMLRPGRLDAVIHVGNLDRAGVEKLIRVVCKPERLQVSVDFDKVHMAMDGFFPAFVREAVDRARTFAISANGTRAWALSTEDLVGAALSLRPQLEAMHEATEGVKRPVLEGVLTDLVRSAIVGQVGMDFGSYEDQKRLKEWDADEAKFKSLDEAQA